MLLCLRSPGPRRRCRQLFSVTLRLKAKAHTLPDLTLPNGTSQQPPPRPTPYVPRNPYDGRSEASESTPPRGRHTHDAFESTVTPALTSATDDNHEDPSAWAALDATSLMTNTPGSSPAPEAFFSSPALSSYPPLQDPWDWRPRATSRSQSGYFANSTSDRNRSSEATDDARLVVVGRNDPQWVQLSGVAADPLRHRAEAYIARWSSLVEMERTHQETVARKAFLERRRRGEIDARTERRALVGMVVTRHGEPSGDDVSGSKVLIRLEASSGNQLAACEFRYNKTRFPRIAAG